ncbi:MAG: hypoxanthine phosphoribosyltransferase [Sphingobacteriaceae bacterium]
MQQIDIDGEQFQMLIDYESIKKRIRLMGIQLNVDFENRLPVFIGVLNGSFMFMADLMKEIDIPCEITFVKLASYHGELSSSQKITEELDLYMDIHERDVIIVEDIVDTGNTLRYIIDKLTARKPASLRVCTLLFKPASMKHKIDEITDVGFEVEDEFVVGYGLDYKGLGRNLAAIYVQIK